MNRRYFLKTSAVGAGGLWLSSWGQAAATSGRPPRILLRSSWQSVNIGDIGHTPGALSLIEKHFPEAEVTLWPGNLGHGSRDLLTKGYPRLKIVEGSLGQDSNQPAAGSALAKAWHETDIYLSGSGSNFPSSAQAAAFHKATGKPVGVFGVSTDPISGFGGDRDPEGGTLKNLRERALKLPPTHLPENWRYVIDRAAFFFCRDTLSRDYLRAQGVKTPLLEFGPDAQLGMHLRDDAKGLPWLAEHGLQNGKFICVIPRLRYTPYYRMGTRGRAADDDIKDAINLRWKESDHAKLRDLIVRYVRATGNKVLACAEVTYQIALAKEMLVDPLPADVKRNVIWRDSFWLPDEAASIYAQAEALICMDCHSPLIAYRHGTPAFYIRNATDTWKGQMYADIGVADWLFEADETSGEELWSRLAPLHADPIKARARVKAVMAGVEKLQRGMVETLRAAVRRT